MRQVQIYFLLLFYCRKLQLVVFRERTQCLPQMRNLPLFQGKPVCLRAQQSGMESSGSIHLPLALQGLLRARTGGCGSVCSLPFSNRICSASSVGCQLRAGLAACSEMGQESLCSCDLLYNKPEAFRSALDQHLEQLVSSVTACDLISVICAVKVIISGVISGGWMCYPTPVPAAYPAE